VGKPFGRNAIHHAMRYEVGCSINDLINFSEGLLRRMKNSDGEYLQDLYYSVGKGEVKSLRTGDIILKDTETRKVEVVRRI